MHDLSVPVGSCSVLQWMILKCLLFLFMLYLVVMLGFACLLNSSLSLWLILTCLQT